MSNLLKELYQKLLTKVRIRADSAPSEHTTRKFRPWKLLFPPTPFPANFRIADHPDGIFPPASPTTPI
jgi:hypothetical protein